MGSRVFIFLGLSMAFLLLVSSGVAARDLAETFTYKQINAKEAMGENEIVDAKLAEGDTTGPRPYGGGDPQPYGGGGPQPYGGGGPQPYGGGGQPYGGGSGSCPKGCCGGGYNRKGCTCC